ncbi:MAG: NAD-dependent DNA ligase LigA [Muribaculaceae bacterium]|jgi:DNA ligase (NAD+)|nr:NAD-dependent DNA ligase LigA [Muribaculaceae bacterium]
MTDDIKSRIDALRKELNEHNYKYYVLNSPVISDKEFDDMLRGLQDLESAHPEFFDPYSPTQRVGSDINRAFTQVVHERPMMSLSNTYSVPEVEDFLHRAKSGLNGEDCQIVGEMKFDGTSISITYEHGRLVRAVTRGDGQRGDDVTANIITIKSIPLELTHGDFPDKFEVRGEILLPWESFERLNKEREYNEEQLFANPRNAAAGTLKLQNSAEVARRGLDAYFYYLLGDNLPADNHFDNMNIARSWGFKVSDTMTILPSIDAVSDFIEKWDTERKHLPVATDGLVFKINSLRQQRNLGFTAKFPRWAIAYKFQAERECTKLKYVSFEVGRTGVITPVANLEPVLLSGTIVKRASLHNADIISGLDIHNGDMVYVEKGGEIIPKIVGVELKSRIKDSKPIEFVTKCPICGTDLVRNEGEAAWVCPNSYHCRPQITGKIEHFVGRHAMNIDGIGEELAEQLYDSGLVENIADIYSLTEAKLLTLDRFKEKSARRILKGIEDSLSVPFERVVFALSIPNVGETVAKKIAHAVHDMDSLKNVSIATLSSYPEIGPIIADSIVAFFHNPYNLMIVERLRNAGLQMSVSDNDVKSESTKLQGKSIVISGVFAKHSRDEYKDLIEKNGGKNVGSVSSKTDFILAGDNMGPAKLEKAQMLGVKIVNEDEFLAMIE